MSSTPEDQNTNTATAKISKWKDPAFLKEYQRQYSRKNRTYKLHPYILEDGRRYKDVYEFPPEFDSKEAWLKFKKERQATYKRTEAERLYIPLPTKHCDICNVDIKNGKYPAHLTSIKHNKNVALLEKHGIVVNV